MKPASAHISRRGFTLIELSIVLVIIGLIIGGVLMGKDLIRAAQIRKIYSEYQQFDTAANTYRLKYNAMPGDHANAYDFFGTDCGTNTTDYDTGCNGNGDTKIGEYNAGDGAYGEEPKFFEHLSRAKLIAGTYDGSCADLAESCKYVPNTNVPSSSFGGAVWAVVKGGCEECAALSAIGANNVIVFTSATTSDGESIYSFVSQAYRPLDVKDMWSLDSKYDDGMPNAGKILSFEATGDCTSDATDPSATYNITTANAKCSGYFRMSGF